MLKTVIILVIFFIFLVLFYKIINTENFINLNTSRNIIPLGCAIFDRDLCYDKLVEKNPWIFSIMGIKTEIDCKWLKDFKYEIIKNIEKMKDEGKSIKGYYVFMNFITKILCEFMKNDKEISANNHCCACNDEQEGKSENKNLILQCARKAVEKNESIFAIGAYDKGILDNMCTSKYNITSNNKCRDGRGVKLHNTRYVYKVAGIDDYCDKGCSIDEGGNGSQPRIFKKNLGNNHNFDSCSKLTHTIGYSTFGLSNNNCYADIDNDNYDIYGKCNNNTINLYKNQIYKSNKNYVFYKNHLYIKNCASHNQYLETYLGICKGKSICSGMPNNMRDNRKLLITYLKDDLKYSEIINSNNVGQWIITRYHNDKEGPIMYNETVMIKSPDGEYLITCDENSINNDSLYNVFLWNEQYKKPISVINMGDNLRDGWVIISKEGKKGIIEYGDKFIILNKFKNNGGYLSIQGTPICDNKKGKFSINTNKNLYNTSHSIWSFEKQYNYTFKCF